jgi:hypothetical protein
MFWGVSANPSGGKSTTCIDALVWLVADTTACPQLSQNASPGNTMAPQWPQVSAFTTRFAPDIAEDSVTGGNNRVPQCSQKRTSSLFISPHI